MPKIHTPLGIITYKTVPLYPGVKKINKDTALENLTILKEILDSHGIVFLLTFGTLLGAVREHDFIEHDEDIDIALKEEQRNQFLSLLPELFNIGFELVRYDRNGLYSLMRNSEYIDFYFYKPYKNGQRICGGSILLEKFFGNPSELEFQGLKFFTHSNYIDFLKFVYGDSWTIPKVYNNYNMSKWKKSLFCAKEHFKDLMPDWLYHIMEKPAKRKMLKRGKQRILRYYKYLQNTVPEENITNQD